MLESTNQSGQQCQSNSEYCHPILNSDVHTLGAPLRPQCCYATHFFKIFPERNLNIYINKLMHLLNTLSEYFAIINPQNVSFFKSFSLLLYIQQVQYVSHLLVLEYLTFCLISSSILTGEPSSATCLTPSLAKPPYSHST